MSASQIHGINTTLETVPPTNPSLIGFQFGDLLVKEIHEFEVS